jgi:hypothetical protein
MAQDEGRLDVYRTSLTDFAKASSALTSSSEAALRADTETLFQKMNGDAAKRLEGYERRQRQRPIKITKP